MTLQIKNLSVSIENKRIVKSASLELKPGQIQILVGPNGSGKSTLANALLKHPKTHITSGKILIDGENITDEQTEKIAKRGLFLSSQHSPEFHGVSVARFLKLSSDSLNGKNNDPIGFYNSIKGNLSTLKMNSEFASRYLNVGFSGGERKRLELLQLLTFKPSYAILDETDAGLDADAIKISGRILNELKKQGTGFLIITHQTSLLKYLKPDLVQVMIDGKIVDSGKEKLAKQIEKRGYEKYL